MVRQASGWRRKLWALSDNEDLEIQVIKEGVKNIIPIVTTILKSGNL